MKVVKQSASIWMSLREYSVSVVLGLIIKVETSGFSKHRGFAPKMFFILLLGVLFCGCSLSLVSQCSALPRNY